MTDVSALYYECHITVRPPLTEPGWVKLRELSEKYSFKVATFIMNKGTIDVPLPEAFTSGRDVRLSNMGWRQQSLVMELQEEGFIILRYKIEDTILDSKFEGDVHGIIKTENEEFLLQGELNL